MIMYNKQVAEEITRTGQSILRQIIETAINYGFDVKILTDEKEIRDALG